MESWTRVSRGVALASSILLLAPNAGGSRSAPGDLTEVEVLQTFDAVSGVRLLEVRGRADGKPARLWLMISERNYVRLLGCSRESAESRTIALSYSDRSHMINVVVCN